MTPEVSLWSIESSIVCWGFIYHATLSWGHQAPISAWFQFSKKDSSNGRVFPRPPHLRSSPNDRSSLLGLRLFLISCWLVLGLAKLPSGHDDTCPASQIRSCVLDAHRGHDHYSNRHPPHPDNNGLQLKASRASRLESDLSLGERPGTASGSQYTASSDKLIDISWPPNLNLVPLSWEEPQREVSGLRPSSLSLWCNCDPQTCHQSTTHTHTP